MARISNYTRDTTLQNNDKLLGSNSTGTTANFQISDITKFLRDTNAAGVSGQLVYQFNSVSNKPGGFVGTFSSGLRPKPTRRINALVFISYRFPKKI